MKSIDQVEPSQTLVINEDTVILGNMGARAKVTVNGNLSVNGEIQSGAEISATGEVNAKKVLGPNTIIHAKKITVDTQIGDVEYDSRLTIIREQHLSYESAHAKFGNYTDRLVAGEPHVLATTNFNDKAIPLNVLMDLFGWKSNTVKLNNDSKEIDETISHSPALANNDTPWIINRIP